MSIVVVLGLAFTSYLYFTKFIEITRWSAHARRVLYHAEQVRSYVAEVETTQRGFGITGNEVFLDSYPNAVRASLSHTHELDSLTLDNPAQKARVIRLKKFVDQRIEVSKEVIEARKRSFEEARALVLSMKGKEITTEIRRILDELQREENILIAERSISARNQFFQFVFAFSGLIVSTIIILIVLTLIINANLKARTTTEEKLRRAEHETKKINQELEAFSYSVSHDLRAPLRSMDGYAQILKEDYSDKIDAEGSRVIGVIINNAKRMGNLIDDLLSFSRVGRQEIKRSRIQMDEVVKPIVNELVDSQKGRKIEVNLQSLGGARVDVNLIRQVWINLISNAIKYSGKREVSKIEIGASNDNSETVYYVRDNGVGFDMKYENKLFGVFQRLHKAEEFEGTGVGLALVKRIIERHHGRIWVEAKLNEGATFYFSLSK